MRKTIQLEDTMPLTGHTRRSFAALPDDPSVGAMCLLIGEGFRQVAGLVATG